MISTITFIITRPSCHRCIYLLIVVIITILILFLPFTITPFIETALFLLFLLSLGDFAHLLIRWSTEFHQKHFLGVRLVRCFSKSPAARSFLLILSYPLKTFCRMVSISTKSEFFLNNIFSLVVSTRTWTYVNI